MAFLLDMKRIRTIEKDFVLKPNPFISEEQGNQVLWKLAVGELFAISSFTFLALSMLKIKPSITLSPSFRNVTYLQGLSSLGLFGWHLQGLDELGRTLIPE